jgi:uncharacterized membrane protein
VEQILGQSLCFLAEHNIDRVRVFDFGVEIGRFGAEIIDYDDYVVINKVPLYTPIEILSGQNDHRIVMMLSVMASVYGGEIDGIEAVKKSYLYIIIMAIALFATSYFKTLAAKYLSAVQLYPLNNGGAVMLSLFMAAVFFKERINIRCIIGICLSFGALLMINFL